MRVLPSLLTLLLLSPLAHADEPRWMRSIAVVDVTAPGGDEARDAWLSAALNGAGALQACADQLPAAPDGASEQTTAIRVAVWDDGRVQDVSGLDALPRSARICVDEVTRGLRFPEDPERSDDRVVELRVRTRWQEARLDLLEVSDEVRRAVLDVPEPTIEGHVDVVGIAAELDRLSRPIARCVSKRRKKVEGMGTRMDVQIRLSRDPSNWSVRVDSIVVVESDIGDEDAEVCVIKQLQKVHWPRPRVGQHARILWPLVFPE